MVWIYFLLFSIFDVLRIFEALQIFFYKFLLKLGKIEKRFESSIFLEAQKYYFAFELRLNLFFKWSYSQRCFDVAQRCKNQRWKWQRCFDIVERCSIQRWNTLRCFNAFERCKFQRWRTQRFFKVDLTLWNVATSYKPKSNVEPTLKCLLGWY